MIENRNITIKNKILMIKIQDCIIWEYIMTKLCLFQVRNTV